MCVAEIVLTFICQLYLIVIAAYFNVLFCTLKSVNTYSVILLYRN